MQHGPGRRQLPLVEEALGQAGQSAEERVEPQRASRETGECHWESIHPEPEPVPPTKVGCAASTKRYNKTHEKNNRRDRTHCFLSVGPGLRGAAALPAGPG